MLSFFYIQICMLSHFFYRIMFFYFQSVQLSALILSLYFDLIFYKNLQLFLLILSLYFDLIFFLQFVTLHAHIIPIFCGSYFFFSKCLLSSLILYLFVLKCLRRNLQLSMLMLSPYFVDRVM